MASIDFKVVNVKDDTHVTRCRLEIANLCDKLAEDENLKVGNILTAIVDLAMQGLAELTEADDEEILKYCKLVLEAVRIRYHEKNT